MSSHDSKSYQYPTGSYAHGKPDSYTTGTAGGHFEDSGYFTQQNSASPSPVRHSDDFVLFDSDLEFIEDTASILPNHGSVYNGTCNSSTAHIPKYTSSRSGASGTNFAPMSQGSRASSQSYVYQPTQSERPSLFGEYELVPRGPSPLSQWAVSPYPHEELGVRYATLPRSQDDEESIRLTPEPTSPPPSPKPRKSKSGSSKSHRRKR